MPEGGDLKPAEAASDATTVKAPKLKATSKAGYKMPKVKRGE